MHCYTQCPRPCSRPPPTHASAGDSWTLMGKSGSVSCGSLLLSPGSWCTQAFVCALQESVSSVLHKFWRLCNRVNGNLLQRGLMPYPGLLHPEPLPLWQSTADPYLLRRHSNIVLAQSWWGLWVLACTRFV